MVRVVLADSVVTRVLHRLFYKPYMLLLASHHSISIAIYTYKHVLLIEYFVSTPKTPRGIIIIGRPFTYLDLIL